MIRVVKEKLAGSSAIKKGAKKGAKQLASSIERLYNSSMAEDTKHEVIKAATTVYPVLLVRHEIGDTITINQRLQKSFGEFLDGIGLQASVKPLVCLSVGVLQGMAALLRTRSFSELLERRIQLDPELRFPPGVVFGRSFSEYGQPANCVTNYFDGLAAPLTARIKRRW